MITSKPLQVGLILGASLVSGALLAGACSPAERTFGALSDAGTDGPNLVCEPGSSAPCYDGPAATKGVGTCEAGLMTCNDDGMSYGACDGQILPATDDCMTPEDEDCDGAPLLCPLTYLASNAIPWTGNGDIHRNIALTPDGNAMVLASFEGMIPVGPMPVMSTGAGTDLLLVKVDPLGQVLWARGYGGDTSQTPGGAAVAGDSTIYVAGSFNGALDFGTGPVYQSQGQDDLFLARLNKEGDPLVALGVGDQSTQRATKVAVAKDGSVFIAGVFNGSMAFPNGPVMSVPPNGPTRIFVVKLAPAMTFLAAVQSAGQGNQEINDLTIDDQGDVLITGGFDGTIDLGGIAPSALGGQDIFISKLSGTDLTPKWLRAFGSPKTDNGMSIAVDTKGSILLTGRFQETMLMDADKLLSASEESIFVTKLLPMGGVLWAKAFGGGALGADYPYVATDGQDHIIVGGTFNSIAGTPDLDFGGGPLMGTQDAGFGMLDLFLAKLKPTGEHVASKAIGNEGIQLGSAVAVMMGDRIMISGGMSGTLDFGGGPIGMPDINNSMFFATYSP